MHSLYLFIYDFYLDIVSENQHEHFRCKKLIKQLKYTIMAQSKQSSNIKLLETPDKSLEPNKKNDVIIPFLGHHLYLQYRLQQSLSHCLSQIQFLKLLLRFFWCKKIFITPNTRYGISMTFLAITLTMSHRYTLVWQMQHSLQNQNVLIRTLEQQTGLL